MNSYLNDKKKQKELHKKYLSEKKEKKKHLKFINKVFIRIFFSSILLLLFTFLSTYSNTIENLMTKNLNFLSLFF